MREECDSIKHYKRIHLLLICILFLSTTTITGGVTYAMDHTIITGEGYTTGCGEGYYTEYCFINYCPLCQHYDCVYQGIKRYDELTCTVCDADYSFSGKEKLYNPRAYLIPYNPPNATPGAITSTPLLVFPSPRW